MNTKKIQWNIVETSSSQNVMRSIVDPDEPIPYTLPVSGNTPLTLLLHEVRCHLRSFLN